MRFENQSESGNIVDRRGAGGMIAGGGIGVLVLAALVYFLGGDPTAVIEQASTQQTQPGEKYQETPEEAAQRQFVAQVLGSTEQVWTKVFADEGMRYEKPKLNLFTGQVTSACGGATAEVGPFYCGADRMAYIDLSFFAVMEQKLGAKGDLAKAYVIAHEIGHHVQNLLGTMGKVQAAQQRSGQRQANQLSVRLELQADYYAGLWANKATETTLRIDNQDVEDVLNAASAIGDDTLQKRQQGQVVPDAFTHGTSEQRVRWFRKGLTEATMQGADTFSVRNL